MNQNDSSDCSDFLSTVDAPKNDAKHYRDVTYEHRSLRPLLGEGALLFLLLSTSPPFSLARVCSRGTSRRRAGEQRQSSRAILPAKTSGKTQQRGGGTVFQTVWSAKHEHEAQRGREAESEGGE